MTHDEIAARWLNKSRKFRVGDRVIVRQRCEYEDFEHHFGKVVKTRYDTTGIVRVKLMGRTVGQPKPDAVGPWSWGFYDHELDHAD